MIISRNFKERRVLLHALKIPEAHGIAHFSFFGNSLQEGRSTGPMAGWTDVIKDMDCPSTKDESKARVGKAWIANTCSRVSVMTRFYG